MNTLFDSSFFVGNRERLRELFTGTAPIVITANGLLQRSSDNTFRFHQDPSFWYLTGIDEPDAILVMDKGKEYVIVQDQTAIRESFDGKVELETIAKISGVETVYTAKEGWKLLASRLKRSKHVATLAASPIFVEGHDMYSNPARARLIETLKSHNDEIELLDLRKHLMKMRMIKQPQELRAIQEAIDITIQTIKEVTRPRVLEKYEYEYQLEAAVTYGFRKRGASGHAYEPIIAGGIRACTIHYLQNNAKFAQDDTILMDVGAQVSHYAADISRTVVKGKPTKRQLAVISAVNEVVEYGLSQLRPGVSFIAAEEKLTSFMGEKLRELGLIRTIDSKSIRTFYPHAPHFLGLDVHDVGDYSVPLEPGMVLTVEPGIYIPKESIGVRIEEDVVITENGPKVLSAALPRILA